MAQGVLPKRKVAPLALTLALLQSPASPLRPLTQTARFSWQGGEQEEVALSTWAFPSQPWQPSAEYDSLGYPLLEPSVVHLGLNLGRPESEHGGLDMVWGLS